MRATPDPLIVLNNVPPPKPTTNPYSIMLIEAIRSQPDIELLDFSWRAALWRRYHVFHAHWPESLMGGRRPMREVRQLLFLLLVIRLRVSRVAIVRTQHNVGMPSGLTMVEGWLLTRFERMTTLSIRLNTHTPLPKTMPDVVIPHGHYRDWYADFPRRPSVAGRIVYFGMIRRYKGVELLVRAFRSTRDLPLDDSAFSLIVAGRPSGPEIAEELVRLTDGDSRIALRLGFLDPADLVGLATSAELIVLPYRLMHNSGAILTALSLGRPVLAPDSAVTRDLSREVGPGWITLFSGELTAADLVEGLARARAISSGSEPNLDNRRWDDAGRAHADAFGRAHALKRRPLRRRFPPA